MINDPFSVLTFESYVVSKCKEINEFWANQGYKDGKIKGYDNGYTDGFRDGVKFEGLLRDGVPQTEAIKNIFKDRIKRREEHESIHQSADERTQ